MKEKIRLLSISEVSKILGLKPQTLYQWSWLGKNLTFIKIGKFLRVSESDLIMFIEENKQAKS
ncbi:helix-turn-helix domain-containing protein [Acidobacteriota bacterium]